MSGRPKKGRKKRYDEGARKDHQDLDRIPSAADKGSQEKTKATGSDESSVFFGYDLPDDITEQEILSFLEEFQPSIVNVEVVLNEKCGNYAKVTFVTHPDARAAMKRYSNQPWYDVGVIVTMKPWKDNALPKKHVSSSSKSRSHRKASPTAVNVEHSSMFFGYDLPDYTTEDDILSFLEEYEPSIVSIEVELNQRHGNYAKVTFETPAVAYKAMDYYSGQYWGEFDVQVVLKPWKEKSRSSQKKWRQHFEDTYYEDDDNFSICSESSQQSISRSYNPSSHFLLPYPDSSESKAGEPIYSEYDAESTESMQKRKKPSISGGSRKEEYTVKISGLNFDIREKDILRLVKPFGDLTSPVRIASFPENGICYAYANYCTSISAREAVSKLDKSKFNGVKIHVCHKGKKLRVDHSCRKELEKLAEEDYYGDTDANSVDGVEQVQGISILHLLQAAPHHESANMSASDGFVSKMPFKSLSNSPSDNISNVYLSTHRSDVSCKHSLDKVDAFSKVDADNLPHIEKQMAETKSRNESSYASVTKSPSRPVKKLSSEKKPSQGVDKKSTITAPEKLNVSDGKCKSSSDINPYLMPTKPLDSKIDIPNVGHTKEHITMVSNESVEQSLPGCVEFLFEKPRQEPGFSNNAVDASLSRSIFSEDSSSNPNLPLDISFFKQQTGSYEDITRHSFATQSSPPIVKIMQDAKPGRTLQQQPKHDLDAVRSNCILEVTNLHPDACVQDLDRYFKPYGDLKAPISIRLDPATDSCYAIVHYVSADAAQKAMIGLRGCDISGYQMHIINANCKGADTKMATNTTLVVSDPVTVYDSAIVSCSNLHVATKKTMENNATLSAQKIGFPIIKSMSKNVQKFLKEQLSHKIIELQQLGGSIEWSDSSVIISGAHQNILDTFDNEILSSLEETTERLVADQWNRLMLVGSDDTSILSELTKEFDNEVRIDLDYANKSITFVGKEQMILKVRQKLFKEICQELTMLGYQMLVLVTCMPDLVQNIKTKWKVTVTGFVEGSTCLNFKGDNIQMAYNYVTEHVGFCKSKKFPCSNIDVSLVTVAVAYIKKVRIAVVICNTSGERILSSARIVSTDTLVVHSLAVKEIDLAIGILKSSPHKKEIKLPSKNVIDKIKESFEEFQTTYTLSVQVSAGDVIIRGYEKVDVIALYEKLKKLIEDLTVRTVEFNASKEKIQFLKHIMFDKPTEQAKSLLSSLSTSKSLKIQNTPVTFTLTGSLRAIEEGMKCIEQELLKNFQMKAVHCRCHPNFLSQIEKFVREPLEKQLNVVIYFFPVYNTERFEPTKTVSIYIKVYSTDLADFEKACEVLTKLDPKSHLFPMSKEELGYIASAYDDGTINLHSFGDPYRARIEQRDYRDAIVMHAFTSKEAEDCLHSLRQKMSSLKVVIHIDLTILQLKYMKMNKQDVLKLCKVTVDSFKNAPPRLKLEGVKSQVERSKRVLQEVLKNIVSSSHKHTHSKYILMWKKCWQELNDRICQDKELYVEFTTSLSDDALTCKLTVVGDNAQKVEGAIASVRKIDGSFKECVISTDAMGVKIHKEGLKSGKVNIRKDLMYHVEVTETSIVIVSPYSMQAEEICKTIEEFISLEKEKRKITKKSFSLKYSFLAKKLKSNWSEVQEIAKSNKILSINLITDPCCGIEVKGNEVAIKSAEPQISQHISSLENDVICSVVPVDYYSRPALTSPEFLQFCKEVENDFPVSLTVQIYPEVMSFGIAQPYSSSVKVEICNGSISLDNSEVIVNFTDENLTVSQELEAIIGRSAVIDCKHHIEQCGPQRPGRAINFYEFMDSKNPMVIHAVMPDWIDGKSGEVDLISAAVTESLKLAADCNVTSVSLPFLSSIDKNTSVEFLAESCLSAVYDFCEQSESIKSIRFVLPINMAKKFENKFTTGLFQQWVIAQEPSSRSSSPDDDIVAPSKAVKSIWLWQDDDNKYHTYQTEETSILNQESALGSTCNLSIGRFNYIIDFVNMTQTNTSTMKVRNIKKVTTDDYRWLFRNSLQKWERFSKKDSLKIEILHVTGAHGSLTINGEKYTYNFDSMTQMNHRNYSKTEIKRAVIKVSSNKTELKLSSADESKITVFGSLNDVATAKGKLKGFIKSLSIVKCIDIQPKLIPLLDKHINQIQKDYRVEIHSWPRDDADSADTKAKYNVIGYKTCVQEAIPAVYQILTSSSIPSVVQSFTKPIEWEPQSDPIELKDVSQGSAEWNKILRRMQETIPSVNLVSIKRIQNEFLWEKYCLHKERMGRKGAERVNEMELFHGTSSNPPEDIYMSEEGFDMRFSREGMWGQGNYFAESARYSCSYAYPKHDPLQLHSYPSFSRYGARTSSSIKQMFLVKVLTGDSYASPSNNTLRMPPYKPSTSSEKIRYDTVNGVTSGSKIYITYSNDKAYPLYLISYA